MSELTPDQLGRIAYEEHVAARAEAMERLRFQSTIADAAMKALMLVNGGALVALFTLVGALGAPESAIRFDPTRMWWAFGLFVAGLVAALLVHLFAFLSQDRFYNQSMLEVWRQQKAAVTQQVTATSDAEMRLFGTGTALYAIAIGLAVLSVVLFAGGAGFALSSFLIR